jgi:hypothetical protein
MPLLALLISAALAAETSPAPAVAEQSPLPTPSTSAAAPDEKQICRRGMNQTGSRMKVRPICMTKKEWNDRARHDKELMDAIQRGSTASTRKPGTPQ